MASSGGVGEHRVRMSAGSGKPASAAAAPEMGLNHFVRFVALIERLGNALGTLAFTWATVVLLGGYSKELSPDDDFWFATAIVFLEATRYAKIHSVSTGQFTLLLHSCISFGYWYQNFAQVNH
jgi:hypothetical protein